MPDITLPGVPSNLDVKSIIDKLVSVEAKKLERLEKEKLKLDSEKSTWITLNNKIKDLQTASQGLYGFRAPFEEKIAYSSNENVLTAQASRTASPSTNNIRIDQIAKNERILSDPIETKKILKEIKLQFKVGKKELSIDFKGGNIENLAETINKQAGDYLIAKITRDTPKTSVLILETRKTGSEERIGTKDGESLHFLKELGLFYEKTGFKVDTTLKMEKLKTLEGEKLFTLQEGKLSLEPQTSVALLLDQKVKSDPDLVLRVKIRTLGIEKKKPEEKPPQKWPQMRDIGKVIIRDVEISGGGAVSRLEIPEKKVEKEEIVVDNRVIGVGNEKGLLKSVEIKDLGDEFKDYTFKLSELVPDNQVMDRIIFINRSIDRKIEFLDPVIEDISERVGIVPRHLTQKGQDAFFIIDGVEVQRSSNQIDDVIKGVTLSLKGESKEDISLVVDRDYELITKRIVDFVEKYNQLFSYINEQSNVVSEGILDSKIEAGVLTGDITVIGLKKKLQNIMMNPYPTDKGRELSLLAQIGISMGRAGSSWDDIRGGYLKVNEDAFVDMVQKYPQAVEQLFGSDNNNDMVVDSGIAYEMERVLKGYSDQRTGIITYHIKNTDTGIREQEKLIVDWEEHLEDYRKRLESDFTVMQEALRELEMNQKSIENFSRQLRRAE